MKQISIAFLLFFFKSVCAQLPAKITAYKNDALRVDVRVKDLLKRMTLEEKLGQMTQLCASSITLNGTKDLDLNPEKIRDFILKHHVGSFLSGTGKALKWVDFINAMQQVAINDTRLGIPIIFGIDHVHGANYVDEGTIFPHQLTMSCSFDTSIAARVAGITAVESADLGLHWNFAPVLDIGKNPFWPRHYETFGEDPFLCSSFGQAFITAYQNNSDIAPYKLAACAKHFVGYSDPKSGWDRTPSEIPMQTLREVFLPPFQKAINAGVKSIMVNSGELNGEAVHASRFLLQELLRKEMGFEGVLLTDIKDISKIVTMHKAAATEKEATLYSIEAGIDMYMACNTVEFIQIMQSLIAEKKITVKRIDSSVTRILKLKFELGLFENPFPRKDRLQRIGTVANHQIAVKTAAESIVLLKNSNNLLPLKANYILVVGFAATAKKPLTGPWTFEWLGADERRQPNQMLSIYEALKKTFAASVVDVLQTADTIGDAAIESMVLRANQADVIVVTAGEMPYSEFKGNDQSLELEASQQKLIKAAYATGKPVVLVLIEGRPRIISKIEPYARAILFAGLPGQGGAEALADIIAGNLNPSGKLSFSYPLDQGHVIPYYHKPSELTHLKEGASLWQYPFGHGLSYTSFTYQDTQLSDSIFNKKDTAITFKVQVKNTGAITGKEVVMIYLTDEVGRITRPVKQLKYFSKVELEPNQKITVSCTIHRKDFAYPDQFGNMIAEQGFFTILTGDKSLQFYAE